MWYNFYSSRGASSVYVKHDIVVLSFGGQVIDLSSFFIYFKIYVDILKNIKFKFKT